MVILKKAVENEDCKNKIELLLFSLGIDFLDISLYILAFVHRSIVNEKPDFTPEHNERLEFLWDAVLELIVTDNLFKDFPEKNEWELTDIRSALVRGKNLAKVSKDLHFDEYLFLWKWEELGGWRNNEYLLANCLEAFLGALYLDLWLVWASQFVNQYVYPTLKYIIENNLFKDFKSLIQEYSQAKYDITPTYEVLNSDWPDHNKTFEVGAFIGKNCVWVGVWSSKKKAQEVAALNAYEKKEEWKIVF